MLLCDFFGHGQVARHEIEVLQVICCIPGKVKIGFPTYSGIITIIIAVTARGFCCQVLLSYARRERKDLFIVRQG